MMLTAAMVVACLALTASTLAVVSANRKIRVDSLDAGPWLYRDTIPSAVVPYDLNAMILRLDRARFDDVAWENVLRRLDALHVQLSPFGQNARRPPHVKVRWWGYKTTEPEAPMRYDARYLETYLDTLEQLAGVARELD